jgi:hypothetical protein
MSSKFEVTRGTKVDAEDSKGILARGDYSVMHATPHSDEVEGQFAYGGWVQCPGCGRVGWAPNLDSARPNNLVCDGCQCHFTV